MVAPGSPARPAEGHKGAQRKGLRGHEAGLQSRVGGCDPPAHTAVGWLGVGVELGPCGVMGLRESSHGAGRVGPKGALLQMLPWPRAKLLASPLLHGSKPCLTSCQGEERRVTEKVQPPPGSQDWDVLLTHRAGLWGPLREGSRQPPACRSGSRLQWPTLATRRHCSPNYLPQGQERGPRAPARRPFSDFP